LLRNSNKQSKLGGIALDAVAILLALVLWAMAPVANAQQTGQPEPTSWRISGKAVDALSGAPLARCSVEVEPADGTGAPVSMETGSDGLFKLDGLTKGKYRLSASKRGYLLQAYEEHDSFWTGIAVGPGLKSEGLIFKVMPQAVITGVVADEHGEPVRRAQVRLYKDENQSGIRSTVQGQAAQTDDRGSYELAHIDPGNYYLAVSAQPWYAQTGIRMPSNDDPNLSASPLDMAYPTTFYNQATNSDDATPIPIRGGECIQADLTLNAQPSVHVRIRLPAEEKEGGSSLMMWQSIFGQVQPVSSFTQSIHEGALEISGILPGHYEFTLSHYGQGGPMTESSRFTGDITSSTTEITPGDAESEVAVTGKVTAVDGKIPSGGITLQPAHQGRAYSALLDWAGGFDMKVPPGDYEIVAQIPQMYLARMTAQDAVMKNRVVTIKAGSTPRLEMLASRGYGHIDGVAVRGGQPASGVMVLLAPDDNPLLFSRDQSDSDGTFTLADIVPGHYRLVAVERGWELEWANREVLNAFLKKSVPVDVRANDKLTQTVEVQSR
jgi:5-hydroxyisourate hydrolase-like protein (transthyretin family)